MQDALLSRNNLVQTYLKYEPKIKTN